MHITHVTHRASPVVGGAERLVHEIASRQVRDGHGVTVICSDADDLAALWDRSGRRVGPDAPRHKDGVRIRRLPLRHLPFGSLTFPAVRRLAYAMGRPAPAAAHYLARFSPWLPDLPAALAEEAEEEAGLLFAWNITLEGLAAAVSAHAREHHVPWIAVPLLHLGRPKFYTMRYQMDLLQGASAIVAQTPTEKTFLVAAGLAAETVHVVGPGVDLVQAGRADGARFRAAHQLGGPVVLSLGPPSREKGSKHVVEAMRFLWEQGLDAVLVLAGPGTEALRPDQGVSAGPSAPHLRAMGVLSEAEKWDAVDAADIVVMPSRTESFGMVYLEAWARRKPVIGARSGAVPDVIEEEIDGLLVPYGDVPQLATAIRALLVNRERARAMGQHGYEKVKQRYQWKQQYNRFRNVVSRVTAP